MAARGRGGGHDRARRAGVRRGGAAVAVPRAPLGHQSRQAVYTRSGWLVQERRIAPISRVQTVDTYRGPLDRLFGLANVTVTTASSAGAVRIVALDVRRRRPDRRAADRHRRDRRRGRDVTHRHRRTGSGSAPGCCSCTRCTRCCGRSRADRLARARVGDRQPAVGVAALVLTVGFGAGALVHHHLPHRPGEVQLRTGVLQRKVLSVPRNRIRSVSTDARLLHRLLGLTVLRVSTGQEARGDAAFALDAVEADRGAAAARHPAGRLAGGRRRPAGRHLGRVLARWQPSWLRYSPLSFTGLAMIAAAVGLAYQAGAAAALREFADRAVRCWTPPSASASAATVAVAVVVVLVASVGAVGLRSLLTFGNLVLRARRRRPAPRARPAAGARAHLRHAQAARRNAAGTAAGAAVRRRPAGCGDDGCRRRRRGVAAAAAVPDGDRARRCWRI